MQSYIFLSYNSTESAILCNEDTIFLLIYLPYHQLPALSQDSKNGTGCTLSSSIATYLALGYTMNEAVGKAKNYLSKAIDAGKEIVAGKGNGPLCHVDFYLLSSSPYI